jgi:hypothetical protein
MSRNLFKIGRLMVPNLMRPERMMESRGGATGLEMESPLRERKVHERTARNGRWHVM